MGKPGELYAALLEELRDHQWHDREAVILKLSALILPAHAIEMLEAQRLHVARDPNQKRRRPLSREQQIIKGSRIPILELFRAKRDEGALEERTVERHGQKRKEIRLIERGWIGAPELAHATNRALSTFGRWFTDPKILDWVTSRLPPDTVPCFRHGRMWRIPNAAVPVWLEYAARQRIQNRTDPDMIVRAFVTGLAPYEANEAEATAVALAVQEELRKHGVMIAARNRVVTRKRPSEGATEADPTEGHTDQH